MSYWFSVATLVGTILGVGMFGLPSVVADAGWRSTLLVSLLVLIVVTLTHLAYAHVVVLTETRARLPGYAAVWLGNRGKYLAFLSQAIGLLGSSVAYLLIGGTFLAGLLDMVIETPPWAGIALYTAAGAYLVWRGVRSIAETEFAMVIAMLACMTVLAIFGGKVWTVENFSFISLAGQPWRLYGVLMFALWGMSVVPQLAEVTDRRRIGRPVLAGVYISFAVTALFVALIIGIAGDEVSRDALSGLAGNIGRGALAVGYGFGVLATFTSHIALTRTNMDMLRYDLHITRGRSFLAAVGIPLVLMAAGVNDFLTVIAVTGAVSLGLEGILALLIEEHAVRAKPRHKLFHIPMFLRIITMFLLIVGIVTELLATFGLL